MKYDEIRLIPLSHDIANRQAEIIKDRLSSLGQNISLELAIETVAALQGFRTSEEMNDALRNGQGVHPNASNPQTADEVNIILYAGSAYNILTLILDKAEADPDWNAVNKGRMTSFLYVLTNSLVHLRESGYMPITTDAIRQLLSAERFSELVLRYMATNPPPPRPIFNPVQAFMKSGGYLEKNMSSVAKNNHNRLSDMIGAALNAIDWEVEMHRDQANTKSFGPR